MVGERRLPPRDGVLAIDVKGNLAHFGLLRELTLDRGDQFRRRQRFHFVDTAALIGSYMLMSDTRRSQSEPRFEYLGCAAGFQETRDVRKRVLRRPHDGRLAVRVLR